jgi:hypothetical protein
MECLAPQASKHGGAALFFWVGLVVVVTNALGCGFQQMGVFFRPDFLARVCSCEWGGVDAMRGWYWQKDSKKSRTEGARVYVLNIF